MTSAAKVSSRVLSEQDYSIGIRPLAIVRDAPAVCGFRETLSVDEDQNRFQSGSRSSRHDRFLEPRRSASLVTDLKGDVTAGPQEAPHLAQGGGDEVLPRIEVFGQRHGHRCLFRRTSIA